MRENSNQTEENASKRDQIKPILTAFEQKQRSISEKISINPRDIYDLKNYRNGLNRLSFILIVLIFPTYLLDSLLLAVTFITYLVVLLLLLLMLSMFLITSNVLNVFLSDVDLPPIFLDQPRHLSAVVFLFLLTVSLATTTYTESGIGVFLQLAFRLELTVFISLLFYLKSISRLKSLIVFQQCQLTRIPIDLLEISLAEETEEAGSLAASPLFLQMTAEQRLKKIRLQDNAIIMKFIRQVLTFELWICLLLSILLLFLGVFDISYFLDYLSFMIFFYAAVMIPVIFSTYHITEINENIDRVENDLKVSTNYQIRLFSWIPKKELFVGVVVTLIINALKIFVRT